MILFLTHTRSLQHILLGPSYCKFPVSCTEFAIEQFKEKSFFAALCAMIKRVLSCNPFNYT